MKFISLTLFATLLVACSPSNPPKFTSPCPGMEADLKEKQRLDAKIKTLTLELKGYREHRDTASANSAQYRLQGMLEEQRLLKETLDRSAEGCSPVLKDPLPVRDPAARDPMRK